MSTENSAKDLDLNFASDNATRGCSPPAPGVKANLLKVRLKRDRQLRTFFQEHPQRVLRAAVGSGQLP